MNGPVAYHRIDFGSGAAYVSTEAQAHTSGSPVHYGRTVVREYGIAAFRDAYRDELGSKSGR